MKNYSIDTLYDEGYINGEVYYLCDENGISCLTDAVKFFSEPELPKHLESLRSVYLELSEEDDYESSVDWSGWKEDCKSIVGSHFGRGQEVINQFNSFPVFVMFIQSQDWLYGQYYCSNSFKDEIAGYWQSRQSEKRDSLTEPWRIACLKCLTEVTPLVKKTISTLINLYPNANSFYVDLQSPTYADEILSIKGFGQGKTQLIRTLVSRLLSCLSYLENNYETFPGKENSLFQNESLLKSLFNESLLDYSVRANNAIRVAKGEYGSFFDFFKWVLSEDFVPLQLKNVGRKTVVELREWKSHIQDFFFTNHIPLNTEQHENDEIETLEIVPVPDKNTLFEELFAFIYTMKDSSKNVALIISDSRGIKGLSAISKEANLSRERVRQLIPTVLTDLGRFLKQKRKTIDYSKDEYFHLVNQCGYSFNKEFTIWVGSQISSEISTIGSYKEFVCKGGLFLMIDTRLASVFDYYLFVKKIDTLATKKYYVDTRVKIEDIVLDCFRKEVKFELMSVIIRTCRTILYEYYPYHLSEDEILIPANAYYSVKQRVEDLLAKEGTALTIDVIRNRLAESGSAYNGTDNQLASLIRSSKMIVSYGIPCKFGLAIWGKPEEDSYGTIRDVAIHILLKHDPPIMPESSLVSALLIVFTDSSWRSIISNLMADSKQRFGIYRKGNVKYVGLTKETYDSSFVLQAKSEAQKLVPLSHDRLSWQGTFDSIKKVLCSRDWTVLDDKQRKWLISNWRKAQRGSLKEWQATQILDLIEISKKK